MIFCLEDLCIDVIGGVKAKPLTIVIFLSISPFMSVSIYFIYLGVPVLDAYMLMKCIYVLV